MFQRAFGFLQPAPHSWEPARYLVVFALPRLRLAPSFEGHAPRPGRAAPCPERPSPSFSLVAKILVRLARLHTASHTPPQASSRKNPSPSRSTGCASRFAHPCNGAAPAEPQTATPHPCTP